MPKPNVVLTTDIRELERVGQGKVRDIYKIDRDYLLIVTTDRISAFDVIMSDGIPFKGQVLTAISTFWFRLIRDITGSHFVSSDFAEICRLTDKKTADILKKYESQLVGRSMLVKSAKVFPVECIVRGYLAGSGWKDYSKTGSVSGVKLPARLKESDRLPQTIFTPSTKATSGHDENISFEQMANIISEPAAKELRDRSIKVYEAAHKYALTKGIIICDTKFEWGTVNNEIILVDEALTPDSSRFWPADSYAPGKGQPSFDKQFLRDYLESINWNKTPPPPKLPEEIINKTSAKYAEAYKKITGNTI
ncbi:MAG: phosphoribosylaminoimidazolesuccinocarboxamide synthase [Candidatus Brocadiia bacterium]